MRDRVHQHKTSQTYTYFVPFLFSRLYFTLSFSLWQNYLDREKDAIKFLMFVLCARFNALPSSHFHRNEHDARDRCLNAANIVFGYKTF